MHRPTVGQLVIVLLGFLASAEVPRSAAAAEIAWRSDLRQAAREANRSGKPLLVDITASWCGYCKKMKKTFSDERVSKHLETCFVPVIVDADEQQQFVEAVGVEGLPTTVIISPELQVVKRITGFRTPAQLERELRGLCPANHEEGERDEQRTPPRNVPRLAFDGLSLVSLVDDRQFRPGTPQHAARVGETLIAFTSADERQRFEANPLRYWPAYGGNCIVTLTDDGRRQAGNPRIGAIYRSRLWFFADDESRRRFAEDPSRYVPETADAR